jgi:23S rRNA U2552 (ribose-2'-O)-methylase RlmE/FtsJ
MNYFIIPKAHIKTYNFLKYTSFTEGEGEEATAYHNGISNSLYHYLLDIKEKIDDYSQWDNVKRYTNPYEYIHTIIPGSKMSVCKYKPISRSYFKMIEIIDSFHLFEHLGSSPIRTFHLAEGPGGFIEAVANHRRNENDLYIGMTLLKEDDENVPGWEKISNFLLKFVNVVLEKGADQTGNLLNVENLLYCKNKYGGSMDFITADGGFDFSIDFNKQEKVMLKLLFAQVCYAIFLQKHRGVFVLKIFDCFLPATIDILYFLSSFYEKTYIIKPNTSRHANSERYVICKGFRFSSADDFQTNVLNAFRLMVNEPDTILPKRFLHCTIPYFFITKLEECNAVIGQQQIENIYTTINLIENKYKNEKIDVLKKNNIQKCMNWCIQYNIPHNKIL